MDFFTTIAAAAAIIGINEAMMNLGDAGSMEELGQDAVERFEHYACHPININTASLPTLRNCGLFKGYQPESIIEYRNETGAILSITELSLVPCFDRVTAESLSYFIRLDSPSPPGRRERKALRQTVRIKVGTRKDDKEDAAVIGGLRYEASVNDRAEFYWSTRTTYSDPKPSIGTISAVWQSGGIPLKVIAGHFNARFGQGLIQWSGFTTNGYNSPGALRRSPSGISGTGSVSAGLCGLAMEYSPGQWTVDAGVSMTGGFKAMACVSHYSRRTTLGLHATYSPGKPAVSADWHIGLGGFTVYGETAAVLGNDGKVLPAAVCGILNEPRYGMKAALLARWYASGFNSARSGLAAAFESRWVKAVADAGFRQGQSQYKLDCRTGHDFTAGDFHIDPQFRFKETVRTADNAMFTTELRGDIGLEWKEWCVNARGDLLWHDGAAWLWYVETGYRTESASNAFIRFTLFKIDSWDRRIYVYERDAPGSFNVPAYYGRGWSLSAVCALKVGRRHAIYGRASVVSYPWNTTPKSTRLEAGLQYRLLLGTHR